jgi:hypothetical protein
MIEHVRGREGEKKERSKEKKKRDLSTMSKSGDRMTWISP